MPLKPNVVAALVGLALTVGAPLAVSAQAVPPPPPADQIDPDVVRHACHQARALDVTNVIFTSVYAAAGIGLLVGGILYDVPTGTQPPVAIAYIRGLGPGLILGAIGSPLARGTFELGGDPLRAACARMRRNAREHTDNVYDTYAADRALRVAGEPPGFVLPLLVGIATAGGVGLSVIPFATNNSDLAGPFAGITAAAIAALVVLPPTPTQTAARRYVRGDFTIGVHAHPYGAEEVLGSLRFAPLVNTPGLVVAGAF